MHPPAPVRRFLRAGSKNFLALDRLAEYYTFETRRHAYTSENLIGDRFVASPEAF